MSFENNVKFSYSFYLKDKQPLNENKELVTLLSTLELGEEIPEVLYLAVAEIIAFAYMLKEKVPEGFKEN